jgi:single-strand DNA-binding protein
MPAWARKHTEPKEGAMDTFVTIAGNLTGDPELRFTPNGHAVANFRLAVTSRVREGDAWKDGDTSFFRVNVWRQQAENVAESLTKGNRVIVSGRLKSRAWETPQGDKRSAVEIDADEVGPSLKWATARPERTAAPPAAAGSSTTSRPSENPSTLSAPSARSRGR